MTDIKKKCECQLNAKQDPHFPKSLMGRCCCTCRHRFTLCGHPWVDGKTMSDIVGYACGIFWFFDGEKHLVMNQGHGVCECHENDPKIICNEATRPKKKGKKSR